MSVESDKVARRKRKAPARRNVPAIVEQREQRPVLFGWGGHLSNREREGLKERIALFAGIVLALVIAGLLGWGLVYDNVWKPHLQADENNRQVAQIGNYVIHLGFFKNFETFENNQFNSQIQQYQQLQAQIDPKKQAAQYQSYASQISSLQQALNTLPQVSLNALIDEQSILQGYTSQGVKLPPGQVNKIMLDLRNSFGGPKHFQQFLDSSGLTLSQIQDLQTAQYLRTKLQPVLAAKVPSSQLQVRASHILVASSKKALAEKLFSEAKSGANFAQLAKKYSIDPGSAKVGGDLGYFTKDRMVAPFANEAFKLKVGQFGLVKSQFGWHIIKVTGRKVSAVKASQLQQEKSGALQTWLQSERSALHLERFMNVDTLPNLATPAAGVSTTPAVPAPVPVSTAPSTTIKPKPVTGTKPGGKKP